MKYGGLGPDGRLIYASKDTTIANFADPSNPVGKLNGISQASFAYDPSTGLPPPPDYNPSTYATSVTVQH